MCIWKKNRAYILCVNMTLICRTFIFPPRRLTRLSRSSKPGRLFSHLKKQNMAIPNALIEDRLRCIVMNYMKGPIEITVMEREEQLGQLPPNVFSFFYCLLAHLGVPSRKPSCNSGHFRQRYRESLPFTRIRTTKDQLILHLLEWGDTWKVRV